MRNRNNKKMAYDLLKQLFTLNMRNFIVGLIAMVWAYAEIKSITTNTDFLGHTKETVDNLENAMLMILGYYLKQSFDLYKQLKPNGEN